MDLNQRAAELCQRMVAEAQQLRVVSSASPCGARLIDCGVRVQGGLETGRRLAEVCLAGLGRVEFARAADDFGTGLAVIVTTDHPVAACMASQYAGWRITGKKFYAMGSGPMRASAGKEDLFATIGNRQQSAVAVGALETAQLPPDEVCQDVAKQCGVAPENLTLLIAPTSSLAGTIQVVARSVETALHKLFELGFDLGRIVSGWGIAPLPPASGDDLTAIGRTNDAILYGAEVMLWIRGDDASLEAIGPQVPSGASADYGQPFAAIFERYNRDFYRIDAHLFSPAVVSFANLDTGGTFRFGHTLPRVIRESFDIRHIST